METSGLQLESAPQTALPSATEQLALLWHRARVHALARSTGTLLPDASPQAEAAAVVTLTPTQQEALERAVFDTSRLAGRALARRWGGPLSTGRIAECLSETPLPSLHGLWTHTGAALTLTREGCGTSPCAAVCRYWREAIDGLVMGLGDEARFSRHRSQGHGDEHCLDVFYPEAHRDQRWGAVPGDVQAALTPVTQTLQAGGVTLTLLGCSERVLFYRLASSAGPACGAGGILLRNLVNHAVTTHCPGYSTVESSPVGVMREEG